MNTNLTQTKSPLLQGATTTTTTTTSKAGLGTFISEASTLGEVRAEVTTASYDVASAAQTTVMYVQLPGPILRVEMPTPVIRFDAATQQVRDVTIAIPYLEKIIENVQTGLSLNFMAVFQPNCVVCLIWLQHKHWVRLLI